MDRGDDGELPASVAAELFGDGGHESGTEEKEPERSESGTSTKAPSASIEGAKPKWTEEVLNAALVEWSFYSTHSDVGAYLHGYGAGFKDLPIVAKAAGVLRRLHDHLFQQRRGHDGQPYKSWPQFVRHELFRCKNAVDAARMMAVVDAPSEAPPTDRRPGYPTLPAHPAADAFPMMKDDEIEKLAADIAENGQHEDIIVHQGTILDGRNRYVACQIAGVRPSFDEYDGDDPVAFVIRKNLLRRHLNDAQRADLAAQLAGSPIGEVTRTKAAELFNVKERSVDRAIAVRKNAAAEVVEAVQGGKVALGDAEAVARLPHDEQREAVGKVERGEAKTLKAATTKPTERTKPKPPLSVVKDANQPEDGPSTTTNAKAPKAKRYRVLASGRRYDADHTSYALIEVEGKRITIEFCPRAATDKWRAFESAEEGDEG